MRIFLLFLGFLCFPLSALAMDLSAVIDTATGTLPFFPNVPSVSLAITATEKVSLIFFLVFDFLLYIISIGAVVMIVFSGVRFVFSFGDENRITKARQTMLFSILGLIAVILSLMIVENLVGIFFVV